MNALTALRSPIAWAVIGLSVLLALVFGGVLSGMLLGTFIVLAIVFTVEQVIPGFWTIAENRVGRIFITLATAWLIHRILSGSDAIVALTAVAWGTLLKSVILNLEVARRVALKHQRTEAVLAAMRARG